MNSLSNLKLSEDKWLVKAVCLAGRFGKYALVALLAVAYVAACFKAFSIVRIALALTLPVLFFAALYIAVKEEVRE